MKKTDPAIVKEEIFDVSKDYLWKAITEVDQMRQWFFQEIPAFNPVVGFETSFLVSTPDREFPHVWKIIEVVPVQKILYDWSYTGYEGRGLVSFELLPLGSSTKLILTNITLEDWPHDIPEFKRESCEGGWDYFIKHRLKKYIDDQF